MRNDLNAFFETVYEIVRAVPAGCVFTYGRVASLAGFPQRARLVGTALRDMPRDKGIPAWRIVNANGRIAPGWPQQRDLLLAEGVSFRTPLCVDLARHLWNPPLP